ncbi:hypothetical protein [Streptomyces sp. NPDC002889]|uniref:hypothetical protein n=1 Tax=Streptomyces sp. NPDC002889 TaxID=3364669 RepID=UPI00368157C3
MGLYIEALIRVDPDTLWERTQQPTQHQRWDLRFTEIDHLPCVPGEPQRFRYATWVLPFLTVAGTGVSAGECHRAGDRVSALRFASPHPLSLLKEGSGYWRYIPGPGGIRFLTGYDYRPRWGRFGRTADRLVFRPLMGWATAWSFDRLRLWCERDIAPERARRNWLVETAVRLLAVVAAAGCLWAAFSVGPSPHAPGRGGTPIPRASSAVLPDGPVTRVADGFALAARSAFHAGRPGPPETAASPPDGSVALGGLGVAALAAALLAPPSTRTPAARRCLRRPPGRTPATAPTLLTTLERA